MTVATVIGGNANLNDPRVYPGFVVQSWSHTEPVLVKTSVSTGLRVDLRTDNLGNVSSAYNVVQPRSLYGSVFLVQCEGSSGSAEVFIGQDGAVDVLSGASPIAQLGAETTPKSYLVRVANVDRFTEGDRFAVYTTSTHALKLRGRIMARTNSTNDGPAETGVGYLKVAALEESTPTSAAAGDDCGGWYSWAFTAGAGQMIYTGGAPLVIAPAANFPIVLIKDPASSSASVRIIQVV